MLTKETTALRRLHGERNHVSLRRGDRRQMKEGKPLPFSVEDRAPTMTTLTATSEAPRGRTRPNSRVATSTPRGDVLRKSHRRREAVGNLKAIKRCIVRARTATTITNTVNNKRTWTFTCDALCRYALDVWHLSMSGERCRRRWRQHGRDTCSSY